MVNRNSLYSPFKNQAVIIAFNIGILNIDNPGFSNPFLDISIISIVIGTFCSYLQVMFLRKITFDHIIYSDFLSLVRIKTIFIITLNLSFALP